MIEYNQEENRLIVNINYKLLMQCWLSSILITVIGGMFLNNIVLIVFGCYNVITTYAIYIIVIKNEKANFLKRFGFKSTADIPDGDKEES